MVTASPVSTRVHRFRDEIVAAVPRFDPNNRISKSAIEAEPLQRLLLTYINWRMRFVAKRPRDVSIRPAASRDPLWLTLQPGITVLLDKVRSGTDLTPHLSLKAWRRGYSPATQGNANASNRWGDKDFALNTKGFHHFHLGATVGAKGFVERTNTVLFAFVGRDTFTVIGLFDHNVFNDDRDVFTDEQARLSELHHEFVSEGMPPGSIFIANAIATSGHTLESIQLAQHYTKIIRDVDPKLDVPMFLANKIYGAAGIAVPSEHDLQWGLDHLDLCIYDMKNRYQISLHKAFA